MRITRLANILTSAGFLAVAAALVGAAVGLCWLLTAAARAALALIG